MAVRHKHSFISLITILAVSGVTVGIMVLVVVTAVMTGAETDIRSRILGVESHVVLMRYDGIVSEPESVTDRVEQVDGVVAATPFINSQIMIRTAKGISGALLKGIDPSSAGEVIVNRRPLADEIRKARSDPDRQVPGIALGKELGRVLDVNRDDIIYLTALQGISSSRITRVPGMKRYRVIGLFDSGMYEYDKTLAYMHIRDVQELLNMGDTVTGIEAKVEDPLAASEMADKIVSELGFPFWGRDWMRMNRNLFSALKLQKTVMFIILTLIVLVAAFNIASTLIMMVMEKTGDIAIMKTMGATDRSIRRIFIIKGMVIGALGTVSGICLGFLICLVLKQYQFVELPPDVYFFSKLPVQIEAFDVLLIASAALFICFIATLFPARQASKLDPVEAIRYG